MSENQFPPIRFEALAKALLDMGESLLAQWLPGGEARNHEWVCADLSGGKGSSCSVNLKNGKWADFSTDERGGDLVSLYAAIHGMDMGKAAVNVARDYGLEDIAGVARVDGHVKPAPPPPPPPKAQSPHEKESWSTVTPIPEGVPEPTFHHFSRKSEDIMRKSVYALDGSTYGYVVRFATSDGGKEDLPYTWCQSARDGTLAWRWRQFDEPRPLYVPRGRIVSGSTIVVVEGEKKADVLQALLDAGAADVYTVVSWPGGCKAWTKAMWAQIAGNTVICWPDCDSKRVPLTAKERNECADELAAEVMKAAKPYLAKDKQPGMKAMVGIGHLLEREHACSVQVLAIDEPGVRVDGWDATDAIETDGWDFARVIAFFSTAYALACEDDAQAPAGKKIEGLVDTDAGGDADSRRPDWLKPYWSAEKGRWLVSRKLVISALRNDPCLVNILGFNELTNNLEARLDWPFRPGAAGRITGATDLLLGNWLSTMYGLPSITRQAIQEGMETVAYEQPFHPIREYLQSVQWDGKPRLNKWLIHVIGESPDTLAPKLLEYLELVGRYWIMGMVARVMDPGCKFDYCMILEGSGGLYKSTLLETLAGKSWFTDTAFEFGKGKESHEQMQGIWVCELGEIAKMAKAEVEVVKAFIASKVDRYRPAYGRVIEEFPRQSVMAGTTNEKQYLRDRTGNRRFWPVPVAHLIRIEWVAKWRDQLFAEAMAAYQAGDRYYPSRDEEERLFVPVQEARLVDTAVTSELLNLLTRSPSNAGARAIVNELTNFVTLSQLVTALGMDPGKSTPGVEAQIRAWMSEQGWEYKKKQVNGVRAYGWFRPDHWPPKDDADEDGGEPSTQSGPVIATPDWNDGLDDFGAF